MRKLTEQERLKEMDTTVHGLGQGDKINGEYYIEDIDTDYVDVDVESYPSIKPLSEDSLEILDEDSVMLKKVEAFYEKTTDNIIELEKQVDLSQYKEKARVYSSFDANAFEYWFIKQEEGLDFNFSIGGKFDRDIFTNKYILEVTEDDQEKLSYAIYDVESGVQGEINKFTNFCEDLGLEFTDGY